MHNTPTTASTDPKTSSGKWNRHFEPKKEDNLRGRSMDEMIRGEMLNVLTINCGLSSDLYSIVVTSTMTALDS
jgi:hypothetical protein